MSRGTRYAGLDTSPIFFADFSCSQFGPIFPGIRTTPKSDAIPIAPKHRPSGKKNSRQIHAERPHQQAGTGLVASAHQDATIERIRSKQFLDFHREEVTVEHRGGFLKRLGKSHRRHFQRETASLPNTALNVIDAFLEMGMTRIDVTPSIHNCNHWFSAVVGGVISHLGRSGAVPERTQVFSAI